MYQDAELLIEVTNSRGTLYAIVEQDNRTAYFYLYPSELMGNRFKPRPCWLRNLQPAPQQKDTAAMDNGVAPMLEARYCNHPQGKEPLQKERISFVWNEEEDGAAMLYDGAIMGVIPGWALYADQPVAYAADCIDGEDGLMFPLGTPATNQQYSRFQQAMDFWKEWDNKESQPWSRIQQQFLSAYEKHFGPTQQYFAIDDGKWPPMALAKYDTEDITYFLSLGMSIRPMPWVEMLYNDNASGFRRAELAIAMSKKDFSEEEIMKVAQLLSGLADRPWKLITWLGEGHTIASSALPKGYESLILSAAIYNGPVIDMPEMYGDKVNLYWGSPLTFEEREFAHSRPNGGYELLELMINKGITHIVKRRGAVV
ncbi:suppressor of fused domain protein [Chitinophaga vietnamensis]|uniref:suppressor of fused domain protein n=1 Tax=Chitinophaga vietnamensis TaxID=2593957 RepID=UPI00117735DE|nr:suppressor of fused domain protein [Chitinophaga vietnamensis]